MTYTCFRRPMYLTNRTLKGVCKKMIFQLKHLERLRNDE
jgi:hypothetical protein